MPRESSVGFLRHIIPIRISGAALSGAGAVNVVNAFTPGFRFWVEKLVWITTDTLVGVGGSQTFNLRKGGPTGTIVAAVVPTVASQATIGTVLEDALTAAEEATGRFGSDTDTLTVERPAGGTAITAGAGELWAVVREREQQRK